MQLKTAIEPFDEIDSGLASFLIEIYEIFSTNYSTFPWLSFVFII